MSLINDALKRAKQAQKPHDVPPPAAAPLRPVEAARPAQPSRSYVAPIIIAVALMLMGGLLVLKALNRHARYGVQAGSSAPKLDSVPTPPPTVNVAPLTTATVQQAVAAALPPAIPAAPLVPTIPPVTQAVAAVEAPAIAPVVAVPQPPPLPKLQGIVFNPARPTAFLNGKSLTVGGRVGEFTVVAITKQEVTIERGGQTNVLRMEE